MDTFSEQHAYKIERTPEGSRLPFIVHCPCQWQSFAWSEEQAEMLAQRHVYTRGVATSIGGVAVGRRP